MIPKDMPRTKCMEPKCMYQSDGSWKWEYFESEEKTSCTSDACFDRQCDDDLGCVVVTDICTAMSNKCYNYTCDTSNSEPECKPISLLSDSTCITEGCYTEDVEGVGLMFFKSVNVKNLSLVCTEMKDNHCKEPKCRYDPYSGNSWCYYVDKKQPKDCEDDKCLACDCVPETGDFEIHEKCVSGDNCTIDSCDIDGVCTFAKVECDNYINMTGFDCFSSKCRADSTTSTGFKCYRKLFPGAYIDICGECIKPSTGESSSEDSSADAMTKCTGAPPRPILKEGLAAATIALIVIFAVVIGVALAASGAYTTTVLVNRARQAMSTNVVSNPMFEDNKEVFYNEGFEDLQGE